MDSKPVLPQPEPVIPQPAPPARKFNPILILAAVILLVAVGTGGLFLGKSLNNPKSSVQPTIAPVPTQIIIPTPDITANWKTYINSNYSFSFRYPPDITIKEGNGLEVSLLPANQPVYQVVLNKKGQKYFVIETSKNYLPDPEPPLYLNTRSTGLKTIAHALWEEYFIPNDYGEGTPIPSVYALTRENNGVLYGIRFSGQKETTEEQNQILSTLQFTPP